MAVLLIGLASLASYAKSAVVSTVELSAGTPYQRASTWSRQLSCIERSVEQALPPGSRVRIATNTDGEWQQRLAEFAFPRYQLVRAEEAAEMELGVQVAHPGPCHGFTLTAEPLR